MEKMTIPKIMRMKQENKKITMVTAYDYPMAIIADTAGIDIILVGDSLGMVMLGYQSTLPVTMDEMIHHCKAAVRGARRSLIVGDMPFMSYNVSVEEAIRNAGTCLKVGCDAIKLEGGAEMAKTVKAIVDARASLYGRKNHKSGTCSTLCTDNGRNIRYTIIRNCDYHGGNFTSDDDGDTRG